MKEVISNVLISSGRNESRYMRETLEAVLAQTALPKNWVIVAFRSTNVLPERLKNMQASTLGSRSSLEKNKGTMGWTQASSMGFYAGSEAIDPSNHEVLCKLYLDLCLPPRYLEISIEFMTSDDCLATRGGKAYVVQKNLPEPEKHGDDISLEMTKFCRTTYFQAIGDLVQEGMWDAIYIHLSRMRGWIACSRDEPKLRFIQLRHMESSQDSIYVDRMRHSYDQCLKESDPMFVAASATCVIARKSYVIGSSAIFWIWIKAEILRKSNSELHRFRQVRTQYQMRIVLLGKGKNARFMDRSH